MPSRWEDQFRRGALDRRSFLRIGGLALGGAALLGACSDDENGGTTGTTGATGTETGATGATGATAPADLGVRIAYTAGTFPSIVNGKVGPLDFGSQFGLNVSQQDDILTFDSHATAVQAVLAGEADVLAGAFTATLLLIQQGQDWKYFCPFSNGNDLLLVGTQKVDEMSDLTNPDVVVGVDSPGGLVNFVMNALMLVKGVSQNVETLNTQIIEDSPLRTAALINGDIDAALVHQFDIPGIEQEIGAENVHVLATLWEDVEGMIFETFAAPSEWLQANPDSATALTKAMLTANRELAKTFDFYVEMCQKYVDGGADPAILQVIWDLARQYEFWSYNGDLTEEDMTFTIEAARQSGLIEGDVDVSKVVDYSFMEAALADIGEVTVEDITG
jgi:ABC-type nitrate/sulfonate/bicarbonate transport system substrate-binding protein